MSLVFILTPFLSSFILSIFAALISRFYFLQCWLHSQAGYPLVTLWPAEVPGSYPTSSAEWKLLTGSHWATFGHFLVPEPVTLVRSWNGPAGQVRVTGSLWCYREGRVSSIWSFGSQRGWKIVTQRRFKKLLLEEGALDADRQKQQISSRLAYRTELSLGLVLN